MADTKRTCSIPECGKPCKARGWCNSHWYRWYRHGDPLHPMYHTRGVPRDVCSIPDCDREAVARGLCRKHHASRSDRPQCSLPNCIKLVAARGWCAMHYTRWRITGSLDIAPIDPKGPCSVPECVNGEKVKGLCGAHYARKITTGDTGLAAIRGMNRPVVDGRKLCTICEEWKPLDDFAASKYGTGGVKTSCRLCLSVKSREWFAANPDYRKAWNVANVERKLSDVHRRRAKYTSPDAEWVDRREVFKDDNYMCQLCGMAMDMSVKTPKPLSPTLDHIVPLSKGGAHTRENTTSAHFHCNISKGNRDRPLTAPAIA